MKMRKHYPSFITGIFAGAALGAVTMSLFDPARGRARRALVRDKTKSWWMSGLYYGGRVLRDIRNRTKGMVARVSRSIRRDDGIDDETLVQRVRSGFGRILKHPGAIDVSAYEGVVTLAGPVLESEAEDLIACVKRLSGVKGVLDRLDIVTSEEASVQTESRIR